MVWVYEYCVSNRKGKYWGTAITVEHFELRPESDKDVC